MHRSIPPFLLSALLWLLTLPALWYTLVAAPMLRVDVGVWGDHTVLGGVHAIEEGGQETYRWTTGAVRLELPNLGSRFAILRLRMHGWRPDGTPPPMVDLALQGRFWGSIPTAKTMRTVHVLAPVGSSDQSLVADLRSPTYEPAGDPRRLGVAIDWIELRPLQSGLLPAPWQFGGQAVLLGFASILLRQLGFVRVLGLPIGAAPAILLLGCNLFQPLWVAQGLPFWLALLLGLILLTAALAPLLVGRLQPWMPPDLARAVWALFVLALAIRLLGALHPLFDARDLPVHARWLSIVAGGQFYLYSTPAELQNRLTFNPPGGYVLLLPFWLALGDVRLAVQAGVAVIDALGCLLLIPLARELGLRPRAALFALALALALPIHMTMLWWGFAANAIAQTLWLLVLWLLLRLARGPTRADLAAFTAALILALTIHIGALVLLVAMLGLLGVFGGWRLARSSLVTIMGGVVLAVVLTVPIYFSAAAAPLFAQERSPASLDLAASLGRGLSMLGLRLSLIGQAWTLGYLPPVLGAACAGLLLLWYAERRHVLQRGLLLGGVIICVVFAISYVGFGLLTRYIYFVAPLICLGAGTLLAGLAARAGGRILAAALIVWVFWCGALLWFSGVLLRIRPSLIPLTQ